jgi:arylsulfatase A-like enzyme
MAGHAARRKEAAAAAAAKSAATRSARAAAAAAATVQAESEAVEVGAEGTSEDATDLEEVDEKAFEKPFFMYVAYTAAHSPLQPLPRHLVPCQHIQHARRRDYCGMVVGLDEGLRNLTASVERYLGENTVMVVASDNGGAAFFGGSFDYCGSVAQPVSSRP